MNEAAIRYRLKALMLSWYSSSNWKRHDAAISGSESEKETCFKEADAYETCANNLQHFIDELKTK